MFNVFCSCNIGEGGIALAEAVHGSAPDIAGKVSRECINSALYYLSKHFCALLSWNVKLFYEFVSYL